MPFTGSFSISQGLNPADITLTDTSVGSDTSITSRQISLVQSDGTLLLPKNSTTQYIDFPLSDGDTISLTGILDKDYALLIQVSWITPTPTGGNIYQSSRLFISTRFLKDFSYSLTQKQAANPIIVNDTNFFYNRMKLRTYIDSAIEAVLDFEDIFNGQYNLDMANEMKENQNVYF